MTASHKDAGWPHPSRAIVVAGLIAFVHVVCFCIVRACMCAPPCFRWPLASTHRRPSTERNSQPLRPLAKSPCQPSKLRHFVHNRFCFAGALQLSVGGALPACPWRPPPGCCSAFIPQVPPPSLYPFRPSPAPWTCGRHSPACLSSSAQACPNYILACDLCVILALGVGLHAAWCPPPCFAPSPPSPPGFVQGPYAPLCRDAWPQYGGCLHPKLSRPSVLSSL